MTSVVQISDYRPGRVRRAEGGDRHCCFNRRELDMILSVYSDRVINGDWKDYAICHDSVSATFRVYRSSSQQPVVTVAKRSLPGEGTEFAVYDGTGRQLKQGATLRDALSVLRRRLRLVGG